MSCKVGTFPVQPPTWATALQEVFQCAIKSQVSPQTIDKFSRTNDVLPNSIRAMWVNDAWKVQVTEVLQKPDANDKRLKKLCKLCATLTANGGIGAAAIVDVADLEMRSNEGENYNLNLLKPLWNHFWRLGTEFNKLIGTIEPYCSWLSVPGAQNITTRVPPSHN